MRLPPVLLIRQLAKQSLFALLFGVRAIAVAVIWLAVLPWITVWTWRIYFSMGDSTYAHHFSFDHWCSLRLFFSAWWISDRPRPPSTSPTLPAFFFATVSSTASVPSGNSFFAQITSHPSWLALSSDIFTGQIIAALIVLTFVAVFLLREWISQNARPGVFEDEEVLEERERPLVQPDQQPLPAPAAPALPPRMPLVDHLAEAERDFVRPLDHATLGNHPVGDRQVDLRGQHHNSSQHEPPVVRRVKDKTADTTNAPEPDLRVSSSSRRRLRSGRTDRTNITNDTLDLEGHRKRSFARRLNAARVSGREHRVDGASQAGSPDGELRAIEPSGFEFTFRAKARIPRWTLLEPRPPGHLSADGHAESPPTHFPSVQLEPPINSIPFGLHLRKERSTSSEDIMQEGTSSAPPSILETVFPPPSTVAPSLSTSDSNGRLSPFSSAPGTHRRPPLPNTVVPAVENIATAPRLQPSSRRSPLPSPSLATYRAPEEFEAGPSNYFEFEDSSFEDEQKKYFHEHNLNEEDMNDSNENVTENGAAVRRLLILPDSEEDTEDDEEDEGETEDEIEGEDDEEVDFEILEGVGWDQELGNMEDKTAEGPVVVAPAPPPPQNGGEPPLVPEGNDDLDGNVEDDMEGAMEGM
jgi:E3 ubiquitin-protein ligase MARCH6